MRIRISLLTTLLLIALIAIGVALFLQRQSNHSIRSKLGPLRDDARELVVEDPDLFCAVELHPKWMNEKKWKIHVPVTSDWQICLATEDLPNLGDSLDNVDQESTSKLTAGTHTIELRKNRNENGLLVEVLIDDDVVLEQLKGTQTHPKTDSTSSTTDVKTSKAFPVGGRIALLNQRAVDTSKPTHQTLNSGVLLWIESVQDR